MDGFKVGTTGGQALPLRSRLRGSWRQSVSEFDTGRAFERDRLRLLLESRRSLLSNNRGKKGAVGEIDNVLRMLNEAA